MTHRATTEILVTNEHPAIRVDEAWLERLARAVLDAEGGRWSYVGVILDAHEMVLRLNRDFLGHDFETDVLSFLIDETEDGREVEVYVDLESATENADRFGTTLEMEVGRYVVHGLLHLAGHSDADAASRAAMGRLEDRYLALEPPAPKTGP